MSAARAPTIVTSHYDEDLSWLCAWEGDVVLVDKHGAAPSPFKPALVIPNRGREASAFVAYIVHAYDALPQRVAFLHGHKTAWHQCHTRSLLDVIRGAKPEYGYVPLNNLFRVLSGESGSFLTGTCDMVCIPIGCQFVVSRERIRKTSRRDWERILASLLVPVHHKWEDYNKGIAFEAMSHTLFGEPLHLWPNKDWFNFEHSTVEWRELPAEVLDERHLPPGNPPLFFMLDVQAQCEYMSAKEETTSNERSTAAA
jgi:hypothetical protein